MEMDKESTWYCSCLSKGEPISAECDLPGLGMILSDLFADRTDIPEDIVELAESCRSYHHEARPQLDDVWERLASECRDYGFEVPRRN